MQTPAPFLNQVALVTGSSRGIGRAIALHLAHLGADVIVNYHRNRQQAEAVAEEIRSLGRHALILKANVAKIEDIDRLFETIAAQFGCLDIFVSNAASGFNRQAMQQRVEGWDWTMNVNARSFLFAAQRAVPLMEARGGSMVCISSPGSIRVLPDYIAVGASKAALESLVRYLAVELAHRRIRVNAVSPGLVETDALKHFAALSNPEVIQRAIQTTPAGRLVQPSDVAQVVAFLCSPAAEMIRGQVIIVDGGYTLVVPDYTAPKTWSAVGETHSAINTARAGAPSDPPSLSGRHTSS
ncbi:MAG: enoyl-[acyl-carrier-protein] reductase FabL [Anaerolineaceae bacterium]|nr:enoyl-[acyl-carrier-protein] reductase FabL [Anaerolineaceae bacterium]